jgi:hypothetical protein
MQVTCSYVPLLHVNDVIIVQHERHQNYVVRRSLTALCNMSVGVRHVTPVYVLCVTLIAYYSRRLRQFRDVLARKRRRRRPLNRGAYAATAASFGQQPRLVFAALQAPPAGKAPCEASGHTAGETPGLVAKYGVYEP